jgi:hypothetical protein
MHGDGLKRSLGRGRRKAKKTRRLMLAAYHISHDLLAGSKKARAGHRRLSFSASLTGLKIRSLMFPWGTMSPSLSIKGAVRRPYMSRSGLFQASK